MLTFVPPGDVTLEGNFPALVPPDEAREVRDAFENVPSDPERVAPVVALVVPEVGVVRVVDPVALFFPNDAVENDRADEPEDRLPKV